MIMFNTSRVRARLARGTRPGTTTSRERLINIFMSIFVYVLTKLKRAQF